jgi:bleomycin hydrolase
MKGLRFVVPILGFLLISGAAVNAQSPQPPDRAQYVPHVPDPVLTEMEKADKKAAADAEAKTQAIVDQQKALEKKAREERKDFRVDLSGLQKPASPEAFKIQAWHFPPVPQYLTGTCWSFSTTSFFESEVQRLTGQKVKISEMWTVYHEYLDKARRYVETRGESVFDEGSESESLPIVWKEYGIVTEEAYPGVLSPDGRFDHSQMIREMKDYLAYCKDHNYWDEALILDSLKLILNRTMGVPPEKFVWEGRAYTPKQFLADVLKLNMDDYVSLISTESMPYYARGELKVEDNWRHDATYVNVPLDVWYDTLVKAAKAGSSIAIGGDVSEPGYDGYQKVAVVPTFDIPKARINQDAREMRIDNETTTDDHGIQIVGYMHMGQDDWFLIKDSARAARKAPPEGYLYYRGDYVKLKMLSYMVHKDFAKDILAKMAASAPAEPAK